MVFKNKGYQSSSVFDRSVIRRKLRPVDFVLLLNLRYKLGRAVLGGTTVF